MIQRSPLWQRRMNGTIFIGWSWSATDAELDDEASRWRAELLRLSGDFDRLIATAMREGRSTGPLYNDDTPVNRERRAVGAFLIEIESLQRERRARAEERASRAGYIESVLGPEVS